MAKQKNTSVPSEVRKAAGVVGKRGGVKRAKVLTKKRKVEIASMGGKAAAERRKGR